jgi:hypothetical protein
MFHTFARKFKQFQPYGRKLTHIVNQYGRKIHDHAEKIGNHIIENTNGPYSRAVAGAIKTGGEYANRAANAAEALDRNSPAEALQHLGFT